MQTRMFYALNRIPTHSLCHRQERSRLRPRLEELENRALLTSFVQWKVTDGGNGHLFGLTNGATTWSSAEAEAVSLGGHLVSITNAAEQDFINQTFLSGANQYTLYWVGLSDAPPNSYSQWTTGEPVSYTNWKHGEPNDVGGVEHYVVINWGHLRGDVQLGGWNDAPLDGTRGYGYGTDGPYVGIVEKDAPDLATTSLGWNSARGGVDFTYTISGADLPQPATGALYWSTDPNFNAGQHTRIDASVITTATKAQNDPYTGHIDASMIGTPPTDASYKYLLFVVNANDGVTESDGPFAKDPNNVQAIQIAPDLALNKAKTVSPNTLSLDYVIKNVTITQPLQFNVYQTATTPSPGTAFLPGVNDVLVGSATLAASDAADLAIGSHTGVMLTLSNSLHPDKTHPFVVVLANPPGTNHIQESDEPNGLDGNNAATYATTDIDLEAVQPVAWNDIGATYKIQNADVPSPFQFAIWRSDTGHTSVPFDPENFDPNHDFFIGNATVPMSDRNGNSSLSAGDHTVDLALAAGLVIDPKHPYVLVVANSDKAVVETDRTNNVQEFTKHVFAIVTHGFIPPIVAGFPSDWVGSMDKALRAMGVDDVIEYDWSIAAGLPVSGVTIQEGQTLAFQVTSRAQQYDSHAAVDLLFIGHSRGAVVNNEALKRLSSLAASGPYPAQLRAGYVQETMLDPHPANAQDNQYSVGPAVTGPTGLLAQLVLTTFQALANDPSIVVPDIVNKAEVYYQHTTAGLAPAVAEQVLNLQGEVPAGIEPANVHSLTGFGVGHSEVHEIYRGLIPSLWGGIAGSRQATSRQITVNSVNSARSRAESGEFSVNSSLYPQFVHDQATANMLDLESSAVLDAHARGDNSGEFAALFVLQQTIRLGRGTTIDVSFADQLLGMTHLLPIEQLGEVSVQPLSASGVALLPMTSKFRGVIGSFTDAAPNDGPAQFAATIQWGDGQTGTGTILPNGSGGFDVSGSHVYSKSGTYNLEVTVDDVTGRSAKAQSTLVVASAGPSPSGYGNRPDAFVTTLYNEALARSPEPAGLSFWSKLLASKVKPRTIAASFWTSRERHSLQSQHEAPQISFGRLLLDARKAWKLATKVGVAHPTVRSSSKPSASRLVALLHR
jgi:hypothetical protein